MRQKQEKLITSFHTTADAIACEKACKENGIPGRMIPVPRQISAGCGLAFCSEPDSGASLSAFLREQKIDFDAMQVILF